MRVRRQIRPTTTWSFKDSAGNRDLCSECTLKDVINSCPRLNLSKVHQKRMVAVRCVFYTTTEEPD
jgi:hypothetical protein